MQSRVSLQPAYVLHRREFQNSSLLIDFFCYDFGRVKVIAKGARREKSRYRALLQLFQPLLISYSGRGEIKTLTGAESGMAPIGLRGERLFSGLYINELLVRLLTSQEEHASLYRAYRDALLALQAERAVELVLRRFELSLLSELGYGINLSEDCYDHQAIDPGALYRFSPDIGFERVAAGAGDSQRQRLFPGHHLLALDRFELADPDAARSAKRILRIALAAHLGERPLSSRALFSSQT